MPTATELIAALKNVPSGLWEATASALIAAEERALADLADVPLPIKRDTFGTLQRAQFEAKWAVAAKRVTVAFKPNKTGSASYLEVRVGDLIITQSAVAHRGALPRSADFRTNLSTQMHLFDRSDGDADNIYALLVHAHDRELATYYLAAIVPNATCTGALARLPLDEALTNAREARRDALTHEAPAANEQIAAELQIKLRPSAAAKKRAKKSAS